MNPPGGGWPVSQVIAIKTGAQTLLILCSREFMLHYSYASVGARGMVCVILGLPALDNLDLVNQLEGRRVRRVSFTAYMK
jgi:hypothetical protein